MAKKQKGRRKGASSGIKIFWAVLALLLLAGAGLVLWTLTDKVEDLREAIKVTTAAAPKTSAADKEQKTEKTDADAEETEKTTTAPSQEEAQDQNIDQKPLNQLLSVVGWALADERPDGFHSKYMEPRDMAALTAGAMTLAAQGDLGLKVELTTTDDPNQVMLSGDGVNSMLSCLVKDGALNDEIRLGSLIPMGSGWAVTLPDDTVLLPRTEIVASETIEGGQLVTAVLIQKTGRGEMVLQTAMVEVLEINGGFGYQVLSWVTQDEVRSSRQDGEGEITVALNSDQRVLALELVWSEDAGKAVISAGGRKLTVTPAGTGKSQVILPDIPSGTEEIIITVEYPAALSEIRVY